MIEFTVPGRPFGKERPRAVGRGNGRARIYTPSKTLEEEARVREIAKEAMAGAPLYGIPLTGPCRVEVLSIFEIPKSWSKKKRAAALEGRVLHTSSPDADNVLKLIKDALNPPTGEDVRPHMGYAFHDDGQVADARTFKRYGQPERVVVRITPLAQWDDE